MERPTLAPTLFRSVPAAWSTSLSPPEALAALSRASVRDGWSDVGHLGARVHVDGDRVRIRWSARGERYHCMLDARARAHADGTRVEGRMRAPRANQLLALPLGLFVVFWAVLAVGAMWDEGGRASVLLLIPLALSAMLLLFGLYARSRARSEANAIGSFVRSTLASEGSPPR